MTTAELCIFGTQLCYNVHAISAAGHGVEPPSKIIIESLPQEGLYVCAAFRGILRRSTPQLRQNSNSFAFSVQYLLSPNKTARIHEGYMR